MKFLSIVGIIFYTFIVCFIGVIFILFFCQLEIFSPENIFNFLLAIQQDMNFRIITLLSGILLILLSYSFTQLILGKFEQERTIAFENPSGPVYISLSAIEDLIKRLTRNIIEIKEARPYVIKRKKSLEIYLRIALGQETNIPDLTNQLQQMIQTKVQEILRIEDPITVKIHVSKIISPQDKKRKDSGEEETPIPFQGYKA